MDCDFKVIIDYLVEKISPYAIYLFGSVVKGNLHPGSDIDIAFLSENKISSYDLFIIAQGLAGILGKEVDLVDLNNATTVFQAQVIGTGKNIYCSDNYKRMVFEMVALKKYARLNEERACILKKIKESGRIYAR